MKKSVANWNLIELLYLLMISSTIMLLQGLLNVYKTVYVNILVNIRIFV